MYMYVCIWIACLYMHSMYIYFRYANIIFFRGAVTELREEHNVRAPAPDLHANLPLSLPAYRFLVSWRYAFGFLASLGPIALSM